MSSREKLLYAILSGNSDANISFEALCNLLKSMGFSLRIKGSHYVFSRSGIAEIINLQDKNGKAKSYQVKQVRQIILMYRERGVL